MTKVEFVDPEDIVAGHNNGNGREHYNIRSLEELGFDSVEEAYQDMVENNPVTVYSMLWYDEFNDGQHRVNFCEKYGLKVPIIRK